MGVHAHDRVCTDFIFLPAQGACNEAVWVYLSSPLGPGLAQLTEQAILRDSPVRNPCCCTPPPSPIPIRAQDPPCTPTHPCQGTPPSLRPSIALQERTQAKARV